MKKTSARRQWTYSQTQLNASLAAATGFDLLSDPKGDLISGKVRLVRVIGCVKIVTLDVITVGSAGICALGLRPAPITGASTAILTTLTADSYWLMRQLYRLPYYSVATTGMIDLNNEPYQYDWQIHGGRGANVQRDQTMQLSCDAQIAGGEVQFHIAQYELWEST